MYYNWAKSIIYFLFFKLDLEKFKTNGVIPDVIDSAPKEILIVKWIQSSKEADLGNEITPSDVIKATFNCKNKT